MITVEKFHYKPFDGEAEKASNSYLMSLIAIMAGLPFPIINLAATLIFYLGTRKSTYFPRWHATQALLSQVSLLLMNSVGFWWVISVLLHNSEVTSNFISYLMAAFIFNMAEFVATIYTAVQTRKGIHVKWWFYGELTDQICKPDKNGKTRY